MTVIKFNGFLGENRALDPIQLPASIGVTSLNQKPGRANMQPWNQPLLKSNVAAGSGTIYRMSLDVASDTNYWLAWPGVVHAVRGPNAKDTSERTYFTGSGTPKWTNTTIGTAFAPYPSTSRELGVPAPLSVPVVSAVTISPVQATGLKVGTLYTVTTIGSTNWLDVGATPTIVDATALVAGTAYTIKTISGTDFTKIGATANTIGLSFTATGAGTGSGTATQNSLIGAEFTATKVGTGTGTATEKSIETQYRYYVYTCVNDLGEESAPSDPSLELKCLSTDTANIINLSAVSGNYGITKFRIYRSISGNSSTSFQFLREIASTNTSTVDDNRTLGESLVTGDWIMPPSDLTNLTGMWNGMMAGITGRSVRVCEPNAPYAWPIQYEVLPSQTTPVALAVFGQTLAILTTGAPIFVTGGSPDALDEQPTAFSQSCIAPASVVSMGDGVAYASPDGLAYIGNGFSKILTEGVMTRDDWLAMNPSSIIGVLYERRYFGFYTLNGNKKGFVIDLTNPNGIYFMDSGADAAYTDEFQDALYILNSTGVYKWDAGSSKMTATFKSKLFQMQKPTVAFACASVTAQSYPLTFKLYADGVLKHTQTVTSTDAFRLPGGYYAWTFQVEVSGTGPIQEVSMGHTMQELAQA